MLVLGLLLLMLLAKAGNGVGGRHRHFVDLEFAVDAAISAQPSAYQVHLPALHQYHETDGDIDDDIMINAQGRSPEGGVT